MKVLSLFDGISCARVAMKKAGIPVDVYYASEIDKYAIQIAQKNWPDTVQIGDVTTISERFDLNPEFGNGIDLLIGGSPCQDLSIAKANRKGLDGDRSGLFWEYVRILKQVKPKFFVLENVASMRKEDMDTITEAMGVQPIMINASLVSGQNRKRLFWVGKLIEETSTEFYYAKVGISLPEDRNIFLKDILLDGETEDLKSLCITASYASKNKQDYLKKRMGQMIKVGQIGKGGQGQRVYSPEGKAQTLSALGGGQGAKTGLYMIEGGDLRKLHPIECERLQGLPDNYTSGVSNTQRYKACGNAFNADVVAHILSFLHN